MVEDALARMEAETVWDREVQERQEAERRRREQSGMESLGDEWPELSE